MVVVTIYIMRHNFENIRKIYDNIKFDVELIKFFFRFFEQEHEKSRQR